MAAEAREEAAGWPVQDRGRGRGSHVESSPRAGKGVPMWPGFCCWRCSRTRAALGKAGAAALGGRDLSGLQPHHGQWRGGGAACCPPFWAVLPSPQQAAPGLRPRPCEPRAGVSQAARGDGATSSADPTSPRWPWGWSGRDRPVPSTQKPVTGLGPLPCSLALSSHPSRDAGRLGTRTGHEWRSGSVHS